MEWLIWIFGVVILAILYVVLFPNGCSFLSTMPEHYGYGLKDGPHTWTRRYNLAKYKKQSPVNIDNRLVRLVKHKRSLIKFAHFEEMPQVVQLKVTGNAIELWPCFPCCPPMVDWKTGANTNSVYQLHHIAFRWSSEHTIDYQHFPLEIQAYFFLTKNPSKPSELSQSSDILAISYLFTETVTKNFYLDPICQHIKRITSSCSSSCSLEAISPFPVVWLCPEFKQGFYQYVGSQTVPPCSETVTWFVNTELFSISSSQLECFSLLYNPNGFHNQRPVQPLNDRDLLIVYFDGRAMQIDLHINNASRVTRTDVLQVNAISYVSSLENRLNNITEFTND